MKEGLGGVKEGLGGSEGGLGGVKYIGGKSLINSNKNFIK